MKKITSFILILTTLIAVLASCATDEVKYTVYVGDGVSTLDPKRCADKAAEIYAANLFSGLYEYVLSEDGTYELACADAAAFPSVDELEDGKVMLTIKLREDLLWSNGEQITPEDYFDAWNAAAEYSLYNDKGYIFSLIDGYQTFLDYDEDAKLNITFDNKKGILTVVLTEDTERFLAYATTPALFPVSRIAVRDSNEWAENPEDFASNGRFTLKELSKDKLVVEKNVNYRNADSVKVDEITFLFESETAKSRIEGSKIDFVFTDSAAVSGSNSSLDCGMTYLAFNAYDASIGVYTPEMQTKLRRAIGIYAQASGAFEESISSLVPTLSEVSSGTGHGMSMLDYADYLMQSVAEESDLFTWQDGKAYEFPILTALCAGREGEERALSKIAEALLEKGITLRIRNTTWNAFLDERDGGDYSFLINSWSNTTASDAEILHIFLSDSIYNDTRKGTLVEDTWKTDYDEVLITAVGEYGDATENYRAALTILEETALVIPLTSITRKIYFSENISMTLTPDGIVRFG